MSVEAKTWRKRVVMVLALIVVLDFFFRIVFIGDDGENSNKRQDAVQTSNAPVVVLMEQQQLTDLLSWSDIEVKQPEPVKQQVVQTQQAVKKAPPAKPKVDIHKQVAARIKGDKSKYLIKDELLTLKGLFYDGKEFAVVEIENIVTKKKQYFRSTANKALGKHKLEKIGKNHVVVSSGQQQVTLYMFGDSRS